MKSRLVARGLRGAGSALPNCISARQSNALMADFSSYKNIAVATTFSPRFKQVFAEAKRIRERFSANLHLIYAGKRNEETANKFHDALTQLQLPTDSTIHYEEGDPADAILRMLAREKIDIIVAGALEKEVVLHPFLGNVARRLVPRSALLRNAFYQTNGGPQTAEPDRFHC